MLKICLIILMLVPLVKTEADEINFPPELFWWIHEVKKANPDIEIDKFNEFDKKIISFNRFYQSVLTYPVFMRWNYSGNLTGYYSYNCTQPRKLPSGKYKIGGDFDDVSTLLIADKNGTVFFGHDFGISNGLNAIQWLTDTVLTGVGINVNEEAKIDLWIISYLINHTDKTVLITLYAYENAFDNNDRWSLKLNWYEHRTDYFEIE